MADLALAILPIILTAIEHFDDVLRPFMRFRHFNSMARELQDEIDAQRTIFRTECQLLLRSLTPSGTAMIEDSSHDLWKNERLCAKLSIRLGEANPVYIVTISRLKDKLAEIAKKSAEFNAVITPPTEEERGMRTKLKEWRRRNGKQLKFSMTGSGLDSLMKDLRRLNRTFCTLSRQSIRWDQEPPEPKKVSVPVQDGDSSEGLRKLQEIQKAWSSLNQDLSRGCASHSEHSYQISLEPSCTIEACADQKVRFKLAFDAESNGHTSRDLQQHGGPSSAERSRSGTLGPEGSSNHVVWFEVESVIGGKSSLSPDSITTDSDTAHKGICTQLQTASLKPTTDARIALGTVNAPSCNHHLYLSEDRNLGSYMPLSKLYEEQQRTSNSRTSLQYYQRLHLAKSLALAALQFHSAPWLSTQWHSANMLFYGTDESLFLSAQLLRPSADTEGSRMTASKVEDSIIPNYLLYALGIMLIELAQFSSLKLLGEEEAAATTVAGTIIPAVSPATGEIDRFLLAKRLADQVGACFGPLFSRIVRKCLRCDFGCGEDLNKPELQRRLYEDVVVGLEGLEKGFRDIQAGA